LRPGGAGVSAPGWFMGQEVSSSVNRSETGRGSAAAFEVIES
jgi:hypothetical protein